ncbi:hypothetical protein N0V93_005390 [Gnomoniopsis smithogilvyi]|uniref:Uncharacterized protein n=1 Tax=Gnomoniopsis smithogilvyi TaxID=1191159 RepID=A0A9W8YUI8_9PEZI|nr:hypothetical protein N0V93_005390 [Gnomoniopsis smithogilvyi]
MAMCLRKVPEYIGELEYWEQHDAEEKGTKSMLQVSEVSSQVYEAVEDMLPSGRGCPQLRTIVREHGMKVIRNAVLEGVLDDHFSLLLVALCFKTKAFMEAEGLLEVILDRTYPKPKSVDSTFDEARSLAPLKTLRDLAQESGRSQFPLRQLSKLLELQKLPLEWLSTKQFASIWSGMVKTLSGDGVCNDTVSCTAHMITLLFSQAKSSAFISRPDKDDLKTLSQQTLISAVSAMTSIGLLRQEVGVKAARYPVQSTASVVAMRIRYIIEACVYKMKRTRKPGWIPTVLNLSAYLLNTTQNGSTLGIRELWHRVLQECTRRDAKRYYEAATAFLSSLARCCGQGAPEPSHHYLTKFCDQLDSTASVEGGKSRQIRADCAFLLAERTNDMRDLVFAESFNVAMESLESVSDTPNKRSSTSGTTGFRWDGDISEWVTKTPAPRPRRPLIEERSPTSVFQTCADETASDSGVSGVEASSAKPCDSDEKIPRRRTRSSATRANRCTQPQGSALGPSTRKRDTTEAGLLSQQLSEHDAEEEQEEEEEDGANSRPRSYHHYRARGQENRASLKSVASGEKRRRVGDATISKPRRAMLRTITNNTCHADLSDDELGL